MSHSLIFSFFLLVSVANSHEHMDFEPFSDWFPMVRVRTTLVNDRLLQKPFWSLADFAYEFLSSEYPFSFSHRMSSIVLFLRLPHSLKSWMLYVEFSMGSLSRLELPFLLFS